MKSLRGESNWGIGGSGGHKVFHFLPLPLSDSGALCLGLALALFLLEMEPTPPGWHPIPIRGFVSLKQNQHKFSHWVSLALTWAYLPPSHYGQGNGHSNWPGLPSSEGRSDGISSHLNHTDWERRRVISWKNRTWILNPWNSKCQPGRHHSAQ